MAKLINIVMANTKQWYLKQWGKYLIADNFQQFKSTDTPNELSAIVYGNEDEIKGYCRAIQDLFGGDIRYEEKHK